MRMDVWRGEQDFQDHLLDGGQLLFIDCSLQVIYTKDVFVEERILSISEQMVSIGKPSQGQLLDKFRAFTTKISDFSLF